MGRKVDVDDLIDTLGVAELLRLKHRNSVAVYRRRYPDFPPAVVQLSGGRYPLWVRQDIEAWDKARRGRS
jgi:hypothetical protein